MDIQKDIETFLQTSGWNVSQLAKAAGLAVPVVSRLRTGARKGLNMRTFEKLRPYIYGQDLHDHQQQASGE